MSDVALMLVILAVTGVIWGGLAWVRRRDRRRLELREQLRGREDPPC